MTTVVAQFVNSALSKECIYVRAIFSGRSSITRVPAVYLRSAFLQFFAVLLLRTINNLRSINPPQGFDSHPGYQFY